MLNCLGEGLKHDCEYSTLYYIYLPLICILTSISFNASLEAQTKSSPNAVVHALQSTLIEVMKEGPEILYAGRYERLEPIINNTHQLPYIARLTVGKYWREMSDEDREIFLDKFRKMVVSSYASKFKKHKGEYFKFVSEEALKRGMVLLIFDLYWANGVDTTRFNYILRQFDDKWMIVNIIIKGISDLALKRAEFTSVIESDGLEILLEKMANNAEEIRLKNEKQGT